MERKLLLTLIAVLVLSIALAGAVWLASPQREWVRLGAGKAGVDPNIAAAPAPVPQATPTPWQTARAAIRKLGRDLGFGHASYYGPGLAGGQTASGERFDPRKLTAAHRTLPLGSRVRVTNTRTGRSVVVRINDRGPFIAGRVIDLSTAAARRIGMLASGTARVRMQLLV
ncbi:septal ring lytic transglycosylase RlpA family protein [Sphingomonadaceae bacterium LXI357]|uniref:Endolytic peptidoglycan transglycosylase RlpA n=2 Tax=Stakelama marina TaxID=2826939 RepID=A0A8T4ILQ6_9SPHN|nr:septal ring lytic transglycosylase RlpA family protein [Stakelama marina]